MSFWNTVKNTFRINKSGYAGFACTTSFPQIVTIGPVVLTVWLPPAVDAKDLDPDLEHEKSVPTVEALLALNLKNSAVNVEPFHKSVKFLPEIVFSSWWEKAFMIEVFLMCTCNFKESMIYIPDIY